MWNETITLFIDDTSIRLLVLQGSRVKKWADSKLEPGWIKGSVIMKEAEVAARIKQLTQSQKIGSKKVILGFSGLHSLTRPVILPQLPKAMLPEAVAREARRVLPVPLDQIYLTWHTIPSAKERIQVFMVAIPRKTADSLVRVVHGAGLELSKMAIKPLALTKALTEKIAILVDVQPSEFDIVIVSDGVPQPIRTVALPEEELSWEQKLDMLTSDLDRTFKFFDTNNPGKHIPESVSIYVSGEIAEKPDLCKELSARSGHPVKILAPILKGPEQINMARYMVNTIMATKGPGPSKGVYSPAAEMNLLPAPYQPKPINLSKVIGIPGGIAVVCLVIPMVMMIQSTSSNISARESQLNMINQLINQKTMQRLELIKGVTQLQDEVTTAKKAYDNFNLALNTLTTSQGYVRGDLDLVLSNLTPSITLKTISESEGAITLTGTAPNKDDIATYAEVILQYARTLDTSNKYSQAIVSSLQTSTENNNNAQTSQNDQNNPSTQGNTGTQESSPEEIIEFTLTFVRNG